MAGPGVRIDELGERSLRELLGLLERGELSALELFERTLAAAEAHRDLEAFVTIDPEMGVAQAQASDERRGRGDARLLEGVPMPIKDMEATRGLRTTHGSRAFAHRVPEADGGAARAARRAGANLFMKSSTTEMALSELSGNPLGIVTRNPLDPRLTTGGSSAGAAAAVAAGIVPAAHGSDGAGSVRLPAALCGIVGFKPSFGVIPRYPISDQWGGRSHHGVLGRTVDDVRLAMRAFAAVDPMDPLTMQVDLARDPGDGGAGGGVGGNDDRHRRTPPLARLCFAALETWGSCQVDPEVARAILAFAERLRGLGLERLETGPTPEVGGVFESLYLPQLAYDVAQLDEAERELLGDEAKYWTNRASEVDLARFMVARDERGRLNRWCCEAFADADFLVLPAQHRLAWPADEAWDDGPGPLLSIGYRLEPLAVFNLLGWPAIALPLGTSADGRAIGVQLACRRGEDAKLLDIAAMIEQVLGI